MRHVPRAAALAAVLPLLAVAGCGGSGQDRPSVVDVFPADGSVLVGWLGCIRVTYDEPVEILSDRAARVAADDVDDGGVAVRILPDPEDPASILIVPDLGGHFFPNEEHHLVVQQGAVVNGSDHYPLEEFEFTFTVGAAPNLFLVSSNGNVYEVDPATGAQVFVTVPPVGTTVEAIAGSDGRVWVWLDAAGDDVLASFVPGTALISEAVVLSGYTGTRSGARLVLDPSGRTLYATARDEGTNRLRVHRIDVATQTETGSIELSPPVVPLDPDFQPAIDVERDRLFVAVAAGDGGFLAVVDLDTFTEEDVGPGPGVDAVPLDDGAGDAAYEPARDVYYVLLEDEATPGFVLIGPEDFAQFPAREPTLVGAPEAIFATPEGSWLLQGVSGYSPATMQGLVFSDADEIGEGFGLTVVDDTGAGPEGSTRVGVLLRDPTATRFFAFADDGVESVLAAFDFDDGDLEQVDLDLGTPGTQSIDLSLSVPGVVVAATTLSGACAP
jgi:hypothetical protein